MEYAVETEGLTKTYKGKVQALLPLDLRVPAGSCFGLLGPNGAGKSTLVKTLLSIVRGSGGSAKLLGRDFRHAHARKGVGYLPEGHRFPRYLTGRTVCQYFGNLAGLSGRALHDDVQRQLDLLDMGEWADKKIAKYSKGMAQRVGLAQAMLGDPKLIFLDEPTDGVDPLGRQKIRGVVKELVGKGVTIFFNSHLLSEVELICDHVAIMHHGRVLMQGRLEDVMGVTNDGAAVRFTTSDLDASTRAALSARGEVAEAGGGFVLKVSDREMINAAIDDLRKAGVKVYAVEPHRVTLEEAFIHLINQQPDKGVGGVKA
ncbi:MAG: ABC transporter ATP-binding protein [Planctomycetes bacterium]|nr:ABC transporter ATP-binding protein [Planctomycetota bacterium]